MFSFHKICESFHEPNWTELIRELYFINVQNEYNEIQTLWVVYVWLVASAFERKNFPSSDKTFL